MLLRPITDTEFDWEFATKARDSAVLDGGWEQAVSKIKNADKNAGRVF
jgi:hypothetical protein